MPLEKYLPDATLQALAAENNYSETAFPVKEGEHYKLRWFTPTREVQLCGHATLASAAVVLDRLEPGRNEVIFDTVSEPLAVRRSGDGFVMDFPSKPVERIEIPSGCAEALGTMPVEVWKNSALLLALLPDAEAVRKLTPRMDEVAALDPHGVVVTARGDAGYDFVSRFFVPSYGVPEDPVTGSAHCILTPFWAARFGKQEFLAFQASHRGGELRCRLKGDRVEIEGRCVFYLEGIVEL